MVSPHPFFFFSDRYRKANQISRLVQIQVHGLVSKLQKFCFRHNYQLDLNIHTQRFNLKSYIVGYFFFFFFSSRDFLILRVVITNVSPHVHKHKKIICNISIYCHVHLINERRLKKNIGKMV